MSTISIDNNNRREQMRTGKMPFIMQIITMTWRNLIVNLRTPSAIVPPLILGGFFLIIYEAQLGNASNFFLSGTDYINFILPLSIISSSLSGAGVAGQSLVRDIESGYFDKLMLTPISRSALILGPIFAGAIILAFQATFIVFIGLLMGLSSASGIAGLFVLVGLALLLGLSFAGFTIAIALFTGNAAATQSANFLFFPLTFLTATFVPIDLLDGWIKVATQINPITYILEAMRALLIDGWVAKPLLIGMGASLGLGLLTFVLSIWGLRVRTSRQ
jgi:ABC-2 type transport system permease protein